MMSDLGTFNEGGAIKIFLWGATLGWGAKMEWGEVGR